MLQCRLDDRGGVVFRGLAVIGVLAGVAMLGFIGLLLRQLAFRDRTAIWIDGDWLIYMGRIVFSERAKNIAAFQFQPDSPNAIVVILRSGEKETIPTRLLSEPTEVVAARLQSWL